MNQKRQRGAAAVEFAIMAPVLITIVLGMVQFGWFLASNMMVANAAASGARYFAAQRGTTTPYSTTSIQVASSAATLNASGLSTVMSVNSSPCTSDSECASDLSAATGEPVTVTVSYSFTPLLKGSVFGLVALPSTLTSTVSERVQ